jgi:hypothetical protein
MNDGLIVDIRPDMSEGAGAVSQLDMSEGNYGAVSLYRIPQSVQDESEKIPRFSGIGIVPDHFKSQTVRPQFSYELLKYFSSHGETECQFRSRVIGFVIFRYRLPHRCKSSVSQYDRNSNFGAVEFAEAGIRMPSETSHKQCETSESSAVLNVELEMPLDPLKPIHVALPKIPLSSKLWITAEITGITLPEHVPCSVLTSSSNYCLQIPVSLEKLPPHNPSIEYRALISQGKLSVNPGTQTVQASRLGPDKQPCNLDSGAEPSCVQELFGASDSKLHGQVCRPRKTVWDMPHILVPIFVPLPLHSSAEYISVLSSTTWTLICGSVASEKCCLMYVPSSVLSHIRGSSTLSPKPGETLSGPTTNVDCSTLPPTSETGSSRCGQYTGSICSVGYDNGTLVFAMDGKEEKASFNRSKVYLDGFKISSRAKLRDVLSCKMPVTCSVKQFEGESFSYKATAVYVETSGKEQLELCQVASSSVMGSVISSSDISMKEEASSLDEATTEDVMYYGYVIYLTQDIWNSCPVEHWDVRKHVYGCVCRVCTFEQNLTSTKSCEDLTVGTPTLPGRNNSVAESTVETRQEVTRKTHLSKDTSNTVTPSTDEIMLNSAVKLAVSEDDQGKVKIPNSYTEFKPLDHVNLSELVDSSTSQTQKKAKSDNTPSKYSSREMKTSDSPAPLNYLPESANNITGIIGAMLSSRAAIMTATIRKIKVGVLIYSKNMYVDGKQCAVTDVVRQHFVEGTQVYADVSKLKNHPSGAVYFATRAWKGKKPTSRTLRNTKHCEKCESNIEGCVDCFRKPHANITDPIRSASKVNLKPKDVIDSRGCQGTHNDVQRGADTSVEAEEQNMKNLADAVFIGTVESFTLDDGFGVVSFQSQNEKVNALFFRERIFAKGVAVTDIRVKEEITAGRLVGVTAVSRYCGKDVTYAADIDMELPDSVSQQVLRSYSTVAKSGAEEQQKVKTNAQDLKFLASKFTCTQREKFYKSRLYYDWDNKNDKYEDIKTTDSSDEVKVEKILGQPETQGDANGTVFLNNKEQIQLPVTPKQHTGLSRQLKGNVARVKRYESSTVGVLECTICGAEMEVMFNKNVVNFSVNNKSTDLTESLPVGTEVYFEGKVSGEDWLLGCPDIVVTGVWESKMHRKKTTSKATRFRNLQLTFPSLREGLVAGRPYEGIITRILPPFAFVATVDEGGKAYEVFVLNKFFSPVEYGTKLPGKHPVMPYVAEGFKVHVLVNRQREEDSGKDRYKWFAMDAWTEQGDNAFADNKPEAGRTQKELNTEDCHDYLEGVIVTVHPDWGLLQADHVTDKVIFFGQDCFLFGIQLAMLDLCQVFRTGKSLP